MRQSGARAEAGVAATLRALTQRAAAAAVDRLPPALQRDLRQFRLLSRDAVRQLIDTALFSRDSDPMAFASWMTALVATPPAFFAFKQIFIYIALVRAPLDVVEHVALAHRLFFVVYAMLTAALLASLTWEALFPDGRDQEVIGTLPVRPYTYAAARLAAALVLGLGFFLAINLPAAAIYTMMASGHVAFRAHLVGLFVGQVVATTLAALFVFATLLVLRGLAAIVLGARAGAWLGAALQLLTVVAMFEALFFLPGMLGRLVAAMLQGEPQALMLPPVWFASLHAWFGGSTRMLVADAAWTGVWVAVAALALVVPVYLVPSRWLARRALESRARQTVGWFGPVTRAVANAVALRPAVRAVYLFTLASLLRSRRHMLVLATYFGVAVAVGMTSLLVVEARGGYSLEAPAEWALALPLVFQFFLVLGLRTVLRLPTEIDANWPFRLTPPTLAQSVQAVVWASLTVAVAPSVLALAALTVATWGVATVLLCVGLQLLAGYAFTEVVLIAWTKVPFACEHTPSPDVLKSTWPLYALALYGYAFRLSDWQAAALSSHVALSTYLATMIFAIAAARLIRRARLRRRAVEFDVTTGTGVDVLKLSGALQ